MKAKDRMRKRLAEIAAAKAQPTPVCDPTTPPPGWVPPPVPEQPIAPTDPAVQPPDRRIVRGRLPWIRRRRNRRRKPPHAAQLGRGHHQLRKRRLRHRR